MAKRKKLRKRGRTPILDLGPGAARKFLLKGGSYCRFPLPKYLVFDALLREVSNYLTNHGFASVTDKPREHTRVNHTILDNKDGLYAWRPMELIHPALYVNLVHRITEPANWKQLRRRFAALTKEDRIRCTSIPVEGTKRDGKRGRRDRAARARQWWEEMEQRSIGLALEYDYVWQTDITDCYGSLYTHSIAWAMHGKRNAKRNRRDPNLLGNAIDACMQDMKQGQTNGVPQGSLLVDLVVELVLCYADRKIGRKAKKANIKDYRILRYRDDYRIFVNNPLHGEQLVKIISEVMYSLGLKLNAGKTKSSDDVLTSVIKKDKIDWNASVQYRKGLQRHISLIREFARKHPHSGSLEKALTRFEARLTKRRKARNAHEMIAIVVDIAARNPRTYAICAAIVSKLLPLLRPKSARKEVLRVIRKRFNKIPNTGHLQLWLQRVTYPQDPKEDYAEPVCRLVAGEDAAIWNSGWITSSSLKKLLDPATIIDAARLKKMAPTIEPDEVDLFEPIS